LNHFSHIERLRGTFIKQQMPLFNFKTDVENIIDSVVEKNIDVFEIETLYYDYLQILCEFYLETFQKRFDKLDKLRSIEISDLKELVIKEYRVAILASKPSRVIAESWNSNVIYCQSFVCI
jgi:hypothetical protein